jgi:hypothetical protein
MSTKLITSGIDRAYRGVLPLVAVVALGLALVACQGTAPGATNPVAGALPGDPGDAGDAATSGPSPTPNLRPTAQLKVSGPYVTHVYGGTYAARRYTDVTFDARGSSDPEGKPLKFEWDFDYNGTWEIGGDKADGIPEKLIVRRYTSSHRDIQFIKMRVTDPGGLSETSFVTICLKHVSEC